MQPEPDTAVSSTARSARQLLIVWANAQDGWVRLATAKVLDRGAEVEASDVDEVYVQYLAEKGLSRDAAVKVELLDVAGLGVEDGAGLRLVRLDSVAGVNALAPDQIIEFNPHLTVIFGENGAGKTGYTRVLKRAAKTRSAEAILGNVHAIGQEAPSAQITWRLDDQETTHQWTNEEGLPPLGRVAKG